MSKFFFEKDLKSIILEQGKLSRKIKAYDGKLMFVEVSFENGGIGPMHSHPHEQGIYCLEGEFEFTVSDETKNIGAGDTIYISPDAPHGCRLLSEKGRLLDVFTPIREDFL